MPQREPRILVVEDNLLIAMDMAMLVEACGGIVVGPVGCVNEALKPVRDTRLTGAVLDVNLSHEWVWPVAALLEDRGVPFVFTTGYTDAKMPERFRNHPLLTKPVRLQSLRDTLQEIGAIRD